MFRKLLQRASQALRNAASSEPRVCCFDDFQTVCADVVLGMERRGYGVSGAIYDARTHAGQFIGSGGLPGEQPVTFEEFFDFLRDHWDDVASAQVNYCLENSGLVAVTRFTSRDPRRIQCYGVQFS